MSCVDFSTPMVLINSKDVGIIGYESKKDLDNNKDLLARLEKIRITAGRNMGLGDVSTSVLPKIALLSPPINGGNISSRYFTPWHCHSAHAVTGGLCIAAASMINGSIANRIVEPELQKTMSIIVEHLSGRLTMQIELDDVVDNELPTICRVGIITTARPLFQGEVLIPSGIWKNTSK